MKLSVVRGGGLAGIVTRTEVASDALPPDQATALHEKVAEAGVLHMADAPAPQPPQPDDLHYELTVEHEGRTHTVRLSDSTMPEPVRSLIAWADTLSQSAVEPAQRTKSRRSSERGSSGS